MFASPAAGPESVGGPRRMTVVSLVSGEKVPEVACTKHTGVILFFCLYDVNF